MKINRLHQILIGVLVLQLILAVVVFVPKGGAASAAGLLLEGIKSEEVSSLTISDDQGQSIKLAKHADKWVLAGADDFPADAAKITPAIAKLLAVKTDRLVAQTDASLARLQVADTKFVRRVDLGISGGATRTLFIGSGAGGSSSHVRLAGKNEVYLAGNLASWDLNADAGSWIDSAYLTVALADVAALALSNANGQLKFTKDASGGWSMAGLTPGETLNAASVTGLLGQVTALSMTRPLGKADQPAYGLAKPGAVLSLTTRKDGVEKVYTLTVGAKDAADSSYVVKSSESPYYARVAEFSVKDLIEKKRGDFLALPAAGTPKP